MEPVGAKAQDAAKNVQEATGEGLKKTVRQGVKLEGRLSLVGERAYILQSRHPRLSINSNVRDPEKARRYAFGEHRPSYLRARVSETWSCEWRDLGAHLATWNLVPLLPFMHKKV